MMMMFAMGCSTSPPNLGMLPCPSKPNCVHSRSKGDERNQIAPIVVDGAPWPQVDTAMALIENSVLLKREEHYRHYTVTTPWMGFVDDVEFEFDTTSNLLHVRSASRVGHSDLGVNRKRVERIRSAITTKD